MKTLYLQTDTTGAFLFREAVIHVDQPHLARLAWCLADGDQPVSSVWCNLIRPQEDWDYEPDAIVAHGIPLERAEKDGIGLRPAMLAFVGALDTVERVVAFNSDFHTKVMQRSAFEVGLNWQQLFHAKTIDCAMRGSTDIVRKPRMQPGGGYSWPKLAEAYRFFTKRDLPSLDLDPIERGIALTGCVHAIDRGIVSHLRSEDQY